MAVRTWLAVGAGVALLGALRVLPGGPAGARVPHPAAPGRMSPATTAGYDIVRSYPHDPNAVTQGLVYHDGFLYESTGAPGAPALRKVDLDTGAVVQERPLPEPHAGEGVTEWDGVLLQLTPVRGAVRGRGALEKMIHLDYLVAAIGRRLDVNFGVSSDPSSLNVRSTFTYEGEGWGLTHDDRRLILSDGTSSLRFFDPRAFAPLGAVRVTDRGRPVELLNELEHVDGLVYANVWYQDRIAAIDPASGRVVMWIDLAGLSATLDPPPARDAGEVLNGIAYDRIRRRLLVTGKRWSRVFEITVRQPPGPGR